MKVHMEDESDVVCGMQTNQRRHKANEDKKTVEWGNQVSTKIILALDENGSDINKANSHIVKNL